MAASRACFLNELVIHEIREIRHTRVEFPEVIEWELIVFGGFYLLPLQFSSGLSQSVPVSTKKNSFIFQE